MIQTPSLPRKRFNFLYGDKPWICADDKLYCWSGTHYEHSLDAVQRPRIASFCNSYPQQQKDGSIRYPFAKPSKVREVLQWVKDRLEIDPELLNPSGLNCTNGVLQITWHGSTPIWQLVDHSSAFYYTYKPILHYNPDANSRALRSLIECIGYRAAKGIFKNSCCFTRFTNSQKAQGTASARAAAQRIRK